MRLGIDIGSTTVKLVLLDDSGNMVYSRYERHMSDVFNKVIELMRDIKNSGFTKISLVTQAERKR